MISKLTNFPNGIETSVVVLTGATIMFSSDTPLGNGAGAGAGTITNAPVAGNPTKWVPINDAGVTRYIPAW
jgi:hypothetical protein